MTAEPQTTGYKKEKTAKQRRFYHRYFSGIDRGGGVRFLTLTSAPDSPEDIHRSFRKLVQRIRRRGAPFEYIAVKEFTRAGRVHLHIVFRGVYLKQWWLSKQWEQCHGATIVWVKRVDKARSQIRTYAAYLAKYLGKKDFNRYWCSWGWIYQGWSIRWRRLVRYWWQNIPEIPWADIIDAWIAHLKGQTIILQDRKLKPPPALKPVGMNIIYSARPCPLHRIGMIDIPEEKVADFEEAPPGSLLLYRAKDSC